MQRLIEKGYKVAICEQLTEPTKGKQLVERDVIRIVTPGTVADGAMLDEKTKRLHPLRVFPGEGRFAFVYGRFHGRVHREPFGRTPKRD